MQVKRTDEMARKLRFFTDQVEKGGLITGSRASAADVLGLDELEVIDQSLSHAVTCSPSLYKALLHLPHEHSQQEAVVQ